MRDARLLLLAASFLCVAGTARAQNVPTADQLIRALKPTGTLSDTTRGIRMVAPAAQARPAVSLTVEFASGSAGLTPQARAALDQLGRALASADLAQDVFRIEGHTDTVGTPAANQVLSQQRAERVAAYLERRFAIAQARLRPVGFGEDGLAVPTPPQTPQARNRRVRIVNLGH